MKRYYQTVPSPVGKLTILAEDEELIGLLFESEDPNGSEIKGAAYETSPVIEETKKWLEIYFSGKEPAFMPKIRFIGSDFQVSVWEKLRKIPYGKTVTYGDLAKEIALERGILKMSAQAVGGAVGKNPICIMVPCHRVVGTKGNLTGFGGGIERKKILMEAEHMEMTQFRDPKV